MMMAEGLTASWSWIATSFPRPPAKRAVAIALIAALSQLGNIAGSYVWGLKANGFRGSYGIVTSMFAVTIVGVTIMRVVLTKLNKKLEAGGSAWEVKADVREKTQHIIQNEDAENTQGNVGFRYIV